MTETIEIVRSDKDNWFTARSEQGVIDKLGVDEMCHAVTCWAMKSQMPYGGWKSEAQQRYQAANALRKAIENWIESQKEGGQYKFDNIEDEWRNLAKFVSMKTEYPT